VNDVGRQTKNDETGKTQVQFSQDKLSRSRHSQDLDTISLATGDKVDGAIIPSDLWSRAYREAINSMKDELDIAILEGKGIEQLFRELDDVEMQVNRESAFMKGVNCLRSLQVPLEKFKLALDLASPLTSLEPTTNAVFGVVRGVTAVSTIWNARENISALYERSC
jgi:hypothetical protein